MEYPKRCFKFCSAVVLAVMFFPAIATAENPASEENFVVFAKSTSSVKNLASIKKAKVLRAAINALPGNAIEGSGTKSVSGAVVVNISVDRKSEKEFYPVVEMKYPDGRLEDDVILNLIGKNQRNTYLLSN